MTGSPLTQLTGLYDLLQLGGGPLAWTCTTYAGRENCSGDWLKARGYEDDYIRQDKRDRHGRREAGTHRRKSLAQETRYTTRAAARTGKRWLAAGEKHDQR